MRWPPIVDAIGGQLNDRTEAVRSGGVVSVGIEFLMPSFKRASNVCMYKSIIIQFKFRFYANGGAPLPARIISSTISPFSVRLYVRIVSPKSEMS